MNMYHHRPTVADMRAMKARGQKISMLYVTTLEEAEAAATAGIHMLSIEGRYAKLELPPSGTKVTILRSGLLGRDTETEPQSADTSTDKPKSS